MKTEADIRDVSTIQRTLRLADSRQKLGKRHGMDFHSEPPERTNLVNASIKNV